MTFVGVKHNFDSAFLLLILPGLGSSPSAAVNAVASFLHTEAYCFFYISAAKNFPRYL